MSAKIIPFPKRHPHSEVWYYFQTYYPLFSLVVSIWSATLFTFIMQAHNFEYRVWVGTGIWIMGLLLLAEFTYGLGVKRIQRLRKRPREKRNSNRIPSIKKAF